MVISGYNIIYSISFEDAVNELSDANYGLHCLLIYPDLNTLREFYSYYAKKHLEEKNDFVLLAPYYETEDAVRKTLSEGHEDIDIDKYEQKETSLAIIDSVKRYFDNEDDNCYVA